MVIKFIRVQFQVQIIISGSYVSPKMFSVGDLAEEWLGSGFEQIEPWWCCTALGTLALVTWVVQQDMTALGHYSFSSKYLQSLGYFPEYIVLCDLILLSSVWWGVTWLHEEKTKRKGWEGFPAKIRSMFPSWRMLSMLFT